MEYKIAKANRQAKVAKRRSAMPVNGRSVFVIQAVIGKKAKAVKR